MLSKILLLSLVLIGCSAPPTLPKSPSNTELKAILTKCRYDRVKCLDNAFETCNGPYYITEEYSLPGEPLTDSSPGTVPWWHITFRCGNPPVGYTPPPEAKPVALKYTT